MGLEDRQREVAAKLAAGLPLEEREALRVWMEGLLTIRDSTTSPPKKAKEAVALTSRSRVVWPVVKVLAVELKRHGWDERGSRARWALSGAAISLAVFGTQGAGIAAFGTAIGVPLWVVLGAGAYFARVMLDELKKAETPRPAIEDRSGDIREVIEVQATVKD